MDFCNGVGAGSVNDGDTVGAFGGDGGAGGVTDTAGAVSGGDAGINISPRRIIAMLQRALNLLTESKLTVDGIIGSKTINSLQGYMDKRNSAKTLLKLIDGFQTTYYAELAEERPKDRAFIYGWIKNRINETLKLY